MEEAGEETSVTATCVARRVADLVGEMLERTDMRTVVPLNFKQDIFNRGILMNPHGLLDALNFKLTYIETDKAKWLDS